MHGLGLEFTLEEGGTPDLGLQGQELSLSEVGPWVVGEACSMALRVQLCGGRGEHGHQGPHRKAPKRLN